MSNRLAVLAADIRSAHEDICRASQEAADRAVDAGRWLAEAKADASIPRGGWERWIETQAGVPLSSARHYIRLFRAVSKQTLTLAEIAEIGQIAALKAASAEADRREPVEAVELVWTPEQTERRLAAEGGQCVVANMHEGIDEALLQWAEAGARFVRIDRRTEWGNPFEMPDDGERAEVVGKFSKFYLPYKDGLLSRMPTLRGKVLGCWCHPEECHGHTIAEVVNRVAAGEGTAEEIADAMAECDG